MIIHFTTVHPRTDTRIRVKEVATLARHWPDEVALFVQDGKGDETSPIDGVFVHDTGAPEQSRLRRMTIGAWRMYRAVRKARPKIAHFHDPELLPWALLLQLHGAKVIYDMHEDLELQIKHKTYIPNWAKSLLSFIVAGVENIAMHLFAANIVVVPDCLERKSGRNLILVANFPSLAEFGELSPKHQTQDFVYVGSITRPRGILETIRAIGLLETKNSRLILMGPFDTDQLEVEARALAGWKKVDFRGWSGREEVVEELSRAIAGLVLLHPTPQYKISYPVKMFEYMAAGLPVIASDFPLWREIVDGARCGFLVDPLDPTAIAAAMQWILDHPKETANMGRRGRDAVQKTYTWEHESRKLITLYKSLLNKAEETK